MINKIKSISISNIRNIVCDNSEIKPEKLIINRQNKANNGSLIIILGKSNSGKTNLLNIINLLATKKLDPQKDQINNFLFNIDPNQKLIPELKAIFSDDSEVDVLNKKDKIPKNKLKQNDLKLLDVIDLIKNRKTKNHVIYDIKNQDQIIKIDDQYQNGLYNYLLENKIIDLNSEKQSLLALKEFFAFHSINPIAPSNYKLKSIKNAWITYFHKEKSASIFEQLFALNEPNKVNNKPSSVVLPNVYFYDKQKNNQYKFSDFINKDENKLNALFQTFFSFLNIEVKQYFEIIKLFNQKQYPIIIEKYIETLNEKLKSFNDVFNSFFDREKYLFKFNYTKYLSLQIFVVDEETSAKNKYFALNYEYQSSFFKFLFNLLIDLYFGYHKQNLKDGDLVLIDDFNHYGTKKQIICLRDLLKQFATKTGISIIITSNCAGLIDLDYLEDVRLINKEQQRLHIQNNFQIVKNNNRYPDTLKEISDILEVELCDLINHEKKIVFVEGVTDYYYLTGIKQYLLKDENNHFDKSKLHKLVFLPMNGVSCNPTFLQKELLNKYFQHQHLFLIDGDSEGKNFKNENKEIENIYTINDLLCVDDYCDVFNNSDLTIENLIASKDLNNFKLSDKKSDIAVTFKKAIIEDEVESSTKNNLIKLIKAILDKFDQKQ